MGEQKNLEKVTKKDTKDVIFDALDRARNKIKELESIKLDPVKKAEAIKNDETIKKAGEVMEDNSLKEMLQKLRSDATVILEDIAAKINTATEDFNSIEKAIKIKKASLNDLFNIEEKLMDLATIINAKEDVKAQYEAEYEAARADHYKEIAETSEKVRIMIANAEEEIKTLNEEAEAKRKKEEEQWEYTFNRNKIIREDELSDELSSRRKKHNEYVEDVNKELKEKEEILAVKEAELNGKEKELAELRLKAESFPAQLQAKMIEAKEEGRKEAEKVTAIKEAAIKREFEADRKVYENEISMLKADKEKKEAELKNTTEKLNTAYAEMREMATSAINANRPVYHEIQGVATDLKSTK